MLGADVPPFLVELGMLGKGNFKEIMVWRPGWSELQAYARGPEAGGGSEGQGLWGLVQPQNGHGYSGHKVVQDVLEYCVPEYSREQEQSTLFLSDSWLIFKANSS